MATVKALEFLTPYLKSFKPNSNPLVIMVSGPQGSGKSYMAEYLESEITKNFPLSAVGISIDDFYLTHAEQQKINETTKNPLLVGRGLPGTHDVGLLLQVLSSLRNREPVDVPQYDKSRFQGQGDRGGFIRREGADIIILEGWFVGFRHCKPVKDNMVEIDANLELYEQVWDTCDLGVVIEAEDIKMVYEWRRQQEHHLHQLTGAGMTDAEVDLFVDRYYPAYEVYYEDMVKNGISRVPNVVVKINLAREPLDVRCINVD